MPIPKPDYLSFLVRLWRDSVLPAAPQVARGDWVAQVEHLPGGEKNQFNSVEELCAYILELAREEK